MITSHSPVLISYFINEKKRKWWLLKTLKKKTFTLNELIDQVGSTSFIKSILFNKIWRSSFIESIIMEKILLVQGFVDKELFEVILSENSEINNIGILMYNGKSNLTKIRTILVQNNLFQNEDIMAIYDDDSNLTDLDKILKHKNWNKDIEDKFSKIIIIKENMKLAFEKDGIDTKTNNTAKRYHYWLYKNIEAIKETKHYIEWK